MAIVGCGRAGVPRSVRVSWVGLYRGFCVKVSRRSRGMEVSLWSTDHQGVFNDRCWEVYFTALAYTHTPVSRTTSTMLGERVTYDC